MNTTPTNTTAATIAANLVALHNRLRKSLALSAAASGDMCEGNQDLAIGSIIQLEHLLPECDTLFRKIITLHRSHSGFEQNEVHS